MLNHTDVKKTRAVIDLNAIAGNYTHTAKACAPAKVAAVVKADAYGHGALAVAKRLNAVGCDFFTVSNIDEALELRTGGITGTIKVRAGIAVIIEVPDISQPMLSGIFFKIFLLVLDGVRFSSLFIISG